MFEASNPVVAGVSIPVEVDEADVIVTTALVQSFISGYEIQ